MVDAYLEIAERVNKSVQKTEEGMLFHSFDRDPDNQHKIVWTEVYREVDEFLFHANNPPVQEYVEKHPDLERISPSRFMAMFRMKSLRISSLETPLKHFTIKSVGYIRSERFA